MEWKTDILNNLLDSLIDYRGKTPKKTRSGIPLITAKIVKGGRILEPDEFIAVSDYDSWMVRGIPQDGDVILTVEAPLGEVAQLDDRKIALAQRTVCLRGKYGVLDSTYLKYFLLSPLGQFNLRARETGTTVTGIKQSELRKVEISYPAFEKQQRIASILSSLDAQIENNNRINANLEAQAQALFKSWFVDFEPWGGVMPEGWKEGKLGDIIEEIESGSRPKGGAEMRGVPSIGAEKIERLGIYSYSSEKFVSREFFDKMKRGHVKDGDVMLYKDGAYTGKTSMALDGFPYKECAVNEHVFLLRTKESRNQCFLYFRLSYPDTCEMVHRLASSKAAQPGLNTSELLGVDIVLPSAQKMAEFNLIVAPLMHLIARNATQSARLAALRDTLLPKLMKGEIEV